MTPPIDLLYLLPSIAVAVSYLYRRARAGWRTNQDEERTDWCAGCDRLHGRSSMRFDVDGNYRCSICRGITDYCHCNQCKRARAEERERGKPPPPPKPVVQQHKPPEPEPQYNCVDDKIADRLGPATRSADFYTDRIKIVDEGLLALDDQIAKTSDEVERRAQMGELSAHDAMIEHLSDLVAERLELAADRERLIAKREVAALSETDEFGRPMSRHYRDSDTVQIVTWGGDVVQEYGGGTVRTSRRGR